MRHADAVFRSPEGDAARQLSQRGKEELQSLKHQMVERLCDLKTVIVSPYVRAQQTAHFLIEAWQEENNQKPNCNALNLLTASYLTPSNSAMNVIQTLSKINVANDVLIVSHQPLIGALTGLLLDGDVASPRLFHTAHIYALDIEDFYPGAGSLRWDLTP